jgi:hypothetical protein
MRRHTMKQPSGPTVSASPMPATIAREKKSSSMAGSVVVVLAVMMVVVVVAVLGVAMVGDRTVGMQHPAVGQMRVVVAVSVDGQRLGRPRPEQAQIFGIGNDGFGRAAAADMAVEAQHGVGVGHDDVEVVRDQEDAAAGAVANVADELVERHLAGKIDTLHRLVEHQQVRLAGKRPGQKRALELAAGQVLHLRACQMRNADRFQRFAISAFGSGPVRLISRSTVSGSVQSIVSFCGT